MHFADLLLILGLHEDHLARGKRKFVLTTALIPAFCPLCTTANCRTDTGPFSGRKNVSRSVFPTGMKCLYWYLLVHTYLALWQTFWSIHKINFKLIVHCCSKVWISLSEKNLPSSHFYIDILRPEILWLLDN
jgi:hypothetical protein